MTAKPTYKKLEQKIKVLEKDLQDRKRKEKAQQTKETRWPSLLESIPNSLVVMDLQGQFLYTNGLPGLTAEESEGKNVYDFIPADHQYKLRQAMKMALLTGDTHTYEIPVRMRGGKTAWYSNSIKPVKRDGQLVEYLAIGTDISEQKKAVEALERRDDILEALSVALEQVLVMLDLEQAGKKVLGLLGKATGVSRAYIFRNSKGENGDLGTEPIYQWIKPGVKPPKKSPEIQSKTSYKGGGFQRWAEILSKGQLIQGNVKDFPEEERDQLSEYSIFSIIIVPIFVGQEWWGFIGFDEMSVERSWSVAETEALRAAGRLFGGVIQRKTMEDELRKAREELEERVKERTKELEAKSSDLEELNTALKVLLKKREEDKSELEEKVLFSVKELISPHLERLKMISVDHKKKTLVEIIESNLKDIISPFVQGMPVKFAKLTPTEIQVANLVKQGKITKEIADFMNVSTKTIDRHRDNIRRKIGINNQKINLRTFLLSAK
jgi:PAS domain S-box-containing protein